MKRKLQELEKRVQELEAEQPCALCGQPKSQPTWWTYNTVTAGEWITGNTWTNADGAN